MAPLVAELPDLAGLVGPHTAEQLAANLAPDPEALAAFLEGAFDAFEPPEIGALLDALELQPDELVEELGIDTLGGLDELSEGLIEDITGLAAGAEALTDGLGSVAEDGLAELVGQLDDDNRPAQRDLALLRELDERAAVTETDVRTGAETADVGDRLESEPGDSMRAPALIGGLVAAIVVLGAVARRRRPGAGSSH